MIELELNKIKVDETRNEQMIIFREKKGVRFLPIVIGVSEVNAIKLKLSGVKTPRPLTYDLLLEVSQKLGALLEKIAIDDLAQNTFFAKLHFKTKKGEKIVVDARPSDSVALALRAEAPIYAEEKVF